MLVLALAGCDHAGLLKFSQQRIAEPERFRAVALPAIGTAPPGMDDAALDAALGRELAAVFRLLPAATRALGPLAPAEIARLGDQLDTEALVEPTWLPPEPETPVRLRLRIYNAYSGHVVAQATLTGRSLQPGARDYLLAELTTELAPVLRTVHDLGLGYLPRSPALQGETAMRATLEPAAETVEASAPPTPHPAHRARAHPARAPVPEAPRVQAALPSHHARHRAHLEQYAALRPPPHAGHKPAPEAPAEPATPPAEPTPEPPPMNPPAGEEPAPAAPSPAAPRPRPSPAQPHPSAAPSTTAAVPPATREAPGASPALTPTHAAIMATPTPHTTPSESASPMPPPVRPEVTPPPSPAASAGPVQPPPAFPSAAIFASPSPSASPSASTTAPASPSPAPSPSASPSPEPSTSPEPSAAPEESPAPAAPLALPSPLPTTPEAKREAAALRVVTGQRYLRMDRPDDAEAEFRAALELDPASEAARRALDALHQEYPPTQPPTPAPLPER